MTRHPLTLTLGLAAALALTACGGGDATDTATSGETTSTVETTAPAAKPSRAPSPKPTKASRCLPVPQALLDGIASGAQDSVGKLTFTRGAAVKSKDYSEVYMVAGEFSAPGIEKEVGVWATNSLEAGGGLILAVDGFANEFTDWPLGKDTKAGITQSDDGVDEAEDCL